MVVYYVFVRRLTAISNVFEICWLISDLDMLKDHHNVVWLKNAWMIVWGQSKINIYYISCNISQVGTSYLVNDLLKTEVSLKEQSHLFDIYFFWDYLLRCLNDMICKCEHLHISGTKWGGVCVVWKHFTLFLLCTDSFCWTANHTRQQTMLSIQYVQ